jgi:hypothetical protein
MSMQTRAMAQAGWPEGRKIDDALRARHRALVAECFADLDQPGEWIAPDGDGDAWLYVNSSGIDIRMWDRLDPDQRKAIPKRLRPKTGRMK